MASAHCVRVMWACRCRTGERWQLGPIAKAPQSFEDGLTRGDTVALKNTATIHRGGSSKPAPKHTAETALTSTASSATTTAATLLTKGCDVFPAMHSGLSTSTVPELRKLAQYEQACNGAVAQRSSFFIPTPSTVAQAQTSAQAVASKLKAYANAGIAPLVFMEPDDLNGTNLDLVQYANGAYDGALTAYHQDLQAAGCHQSDDGMLGISPPEGDGPTWSTSDPQQCTVPWRLSGYHAKAIFPR